MGQKYFQVNAFTNKQFSGNPAVVCILPGPQEDQWMLKVAREMNLSHTAFLFRHGDSFSLRWVTPLGEVDRCCLGLCCHATLAGAYVLGKEGCLRPGEPTSFSTRGGFLTATHKGDWIELDLPAVQEKRVAGSADLVRALGVTPTYVGMSPFDYLVEVPSEETLRNMYPDFAALAAIPVRGVIVTSHARSKDYDFVSRFFAPRAGINECPVSGAAHCCLGPYWGARLNKTELIAYQASARGGVVRVRLDGDRVHLAGQAVVVLRGELTEEMAD